MKVLIVDDEILTINGLLQLIPWSELDTTIVGTATDGEEAYRIALAEKPDLIITDIKMSNMDGLELSKKVHDTMADTEIIILSAYDDFDYARLALKFGVKGYILKPIDLEKVEQIIEDVKLISDRIRRRLNIDNAVFSSMYKQQVHEALQRLDEDFITSFFTNELPLMSLDINEVKEFSKGLINILFDFMLEMHLNIESEAYSRKNVVEELYARKTASDIINYTQTIYKDILHHITRKKDSHIESLVEYARQYIEMHLADANMSATLISDKLNISAAYLSLIFHTITGVNLSTYITRHRIEKACELMEDPLNNIMNIAKLTGYQDPQYFTKVFKKVKGMTPSEYRNIIMGKNCELP